jgi:hypothetical protein
MPEVASAVIQTSTEGADAARSGLESLVGGLTNIAGVAAGIAVAGLAAFSGAIGYSIQQAMDAQDVMVQTEARIKATGGVAGVSAEQVVDLALGLQNISGVGHETIQTAENILLTFTDIGEKTFPGATKAALDLSVAMGTDMAQSSRKLGELLEDPIHNFDALKRAGITFDDQIKANVRTLEAAGRTEEAQQILLDAIAHKVGGAAEAAGTTASGQWKIFQERLGNIAEDVGSHFLPGMGDLLTLFEGPLFNVLQGKIVPIIEVLGDRFAEFTGLITDGMDPVSAFKESIGDLLPPELQGAFGGFVDLLGRAQDAFTALASGDLAGAFANFLPAGVADKIPGLVTSFADFATAAGNVVSSGIEGFLNSFGSAFSDAFKADGPGMIDNLTSALDGWAKFFKDNGPAIETALKNFGKFAGDTAVGLLDLASGILAVTGDLASGDFKKGLEDAGKAAHGFADNVSKGVGDPGGWDHVVEVWKGNFDLLGKGIDAAMKQWLPALAAEWGAGLTNWILITADKIETQLPALVFGGLLLTIGRVVLATPLMIQAGLRFVGGLVDTFAQRIAELPAKLIDGIGKAVDAGLLQVQKFIDMGIAFGQGLVKGFEGVVPTIIQTIIDLAINALTAVMATLGIQSPSRKMAEIGGYTAEGLALGIRRNADMPAEALSDIGKSLLKTGFNMPAIPLRSTQTNETHHAGDQYIQDAHFYLPSDGNPFDVLRTARMGRAGV